jgi:hypothetical protein
VKVYLHLAGVGEQGLRREAGFLFYEFAMTQITFPDLVIWGS